MMKKNDSFDENAQSPFSLVLIKKPLKFQNYSTSSFEVGNLKKLLIKFEIFTDGIDISLLHGVLVLVVLLFLCHSQISLLLSSDDATGTFIFSWS